MKIAIASDHGGYQLKEAVREYLESRGIEVLDLGTYSEESVDYPRSMRTDIIISRTWTPWISICSTII